MTCTQCFQKIASSTLEKSCKGEHRHQGEGEEEWEFSREAKGLGMLCLPLGSSETHPLTLQAHPLRLTPGLAHFGGWGSPGSLCIFGCGGSPQPWPWRPGSSVPGGGVPGGGCLPSWAVHYLWIQQILAGTCFQNLELFPQGLFLWCFRVCTTHLSGDLWAGSQNLLCSRRVPCSVGLSPTPPRPLSPLVDILFTVLCFSSQALGSRSVERPEGCTGALFSESNHKVLLEILFNLWNVYISGDERFLYSALLFGVCISVLRWTGQVGREASSLRSKDKPSRKHDRAQRLYLSLEWARTGLQGLLFFFLLIKTVLWKDDLEIKDILYYVRKFLVLSINADWSLTKRFQKPQAIWPCDLEEGNLDTSPV